MSATDKGREFQHSKKNPSYEEEFTGLETYEERKNSLEIIDIIGSLMQDEDFSLEDENSFTINKILAFLNKEVTQNQYFTEAWLIKGTVLYKTGKYSGSIEAFDSALETIPEVISKENLHLWKKSDNINYKYALKFKALALFKLRRHKEALGAINEILAFYPEDVEIQKYKDMLCTLEDESLIKELNSPPYNSPEESGSQKHRDRQVYEPDRYVRALEEFDKSLEINPNDADIWSYKGSALYILGRYEEALDSFDKSLVINPKNENVWSFKGSTLYMLDRPEKALKAFDKALQKNPNKLEAWFNKGSILFELGRYKQSLSAVENALRVNAEDTNTLNLKNSILRKLETNKEPIT
jgi:tetratricopeptide (TPR) repeat protein